MKKHQSVHKILQQITKKVSYVTMWWSLKSNAGLICCKLKQSPIQLKCHKEAHLKSPSFSSSIMSWNSTWRNILFLDEKKFNLDGPDGNNYCCHDFMQKSYEIFSRQMGGTSIMVRDAFSCAGKCNIRRVEEKMNSDSYQQMLFQCQTM